MKKRSKFKTILIVLIVGLAVVAGIGFYMFNMPHRDVQASKIDYSLSANELVNEYLSNPDAANNKYLQEEGESKILLVSGTIASINKDQKGQFVVLLKNAESLAGVSCTFIAETNKNAEKLRIGEEVEIKGVIRSGASFDNDLEMYEDVIMEKCDLQLNNK